MNRERALRLIEDGRMTEAGLAVLGDLSVEGFEVPPDILERLQADPAVWANFEAFPDSYKRIRIGFIEGARRRPDVFEQRLVYFLRMTAAGKMFGMVR